MVIRSEWHRLGHRTDVRGEEINICKNDGSVKEVQRKLCKKSHGRAEERKAKQKYENEEDDEVYRMQIQGGDFDRKAAIQKAHVERKERVRR